MRQPTTLASGLGVEAAGIPVFTTKRIPGETKVNTLYSNRCSMNSELSGQLYKLQSDWIRILSNILEVLHNSLLNQLVG